MTGKLPILKQVKISKILGVEVVGKRCYVEVLFESGYRTSLNAFEGKSVGTHKDSHLDMVIPLGTEMLSFKVSRGGYGWYRLSRLSIKMLNGDL